VRLALAMWSRPAEPGCRGEDERPWSTTLDGLELTELCDRRLVHVASDDELRSGRGERLENVAAPLQRPLSRGAPRGSGEMVVKGRNPEGARGCLTESFRNAIEGGVGHRASLLSPRTHGVQPHDEDVLCRVDGLRRSENAIPVRERVRESRGKGVRDVVISRNREDGRAQRMEKRCGTLELRALPAVREIAGGEHELRSKLRGELAQRGDGLGLLASPDVEVRDVENSRGHGRGRLYTRVVANEAPELFDDVYLGLRAGGAVRKQRRGEPLSAEEEEAIGRWRRLSLWRKFIAVGAFALGTFGLGFTVGGLIFGRWRAARR